jgi:hypothetical protein
MENKMENNKYEMSGFYFGKENLFNLIIRANKPTGYGYSVELAIELTAEERQQLITLLLTAPKEDN